MLREGGHFLHGEVSTKILLLSSNRELARRQLGSCSKGWLEVHRQNAWQTLELAAIQDGAEPPDDSPDVDLVHATVQQFAYALPSLQREIAHATRCLKLSIVHVMALTAHYRAFAQCPFRSIEHLIIDGPAGYARDVDIDEFRWGVIFSPMLCTVLSFTMTCDIDGLCSRDWDSGNLFLKSFVFSFMHLHTIDLTCRGFDVEPDDVFDFPNLIAVQGLFRMFADMDPWQTWLTKAPNLERLAIEFEMVPHEQVVRFFVFLKNACPKIRGLKILFLGITITTDTFRHLPEGLETLCLQFDSYNEIDTILSRETAVTAFNNKDIESFLRRWVRPHCDLIVHDSLPIETLNECIGP